LGRRIEAAREISSVFSSGCPTLPKGFEQFGIAGPSSHIRAYKLDMKRLQDQFPFLTTLDLYLATLAWKLGTQNPDHSSCSERNRKSLDTPLAGEALEAQQSYAAPSSSAIDQM